MGGDASFTWHNKRKGSEAIFERLDRFVITSTWYDIFALSKVDALDTYGSDRALLLKIIPAAQRIQVRGRKRFHFEQKWFFDKTFVEDFLMEWKKLGGNTLPKRLSKSQDFLTTWAGSRFDSLGK